MAQIVKRHRGRHRLRRPLRRQGRRPGSTATVKNKAGEFVEPTLEGASAAVEGAEITDDLTYYPLGPTATSAYPIAAPTWIIVYKNQTDKDKGARRQGVPGLTSSPTARSWPAELDYAPLPDELAEKALAQIDKIGA